MPRPAFRLPIGKIRNEYRVKLIFHFSICFQLCQVGAEGIPPIFLQPFVLIIFVAKAFLKDRVA